jgi:light-regulated signal transduction histidine kinase (bacteriophytochrome)
LGIEKNIPNEFFLQNEQVKKITEEFISFSYAISHDLRSPIHAIDSFSEMLEEDLFETIDTESLENLKRLRLASKKLVSMLEAINSLCTINKQTIEKKELDIAQVAQKIINKIKTNNPDSTAEFIISTNLLVNADEKLFEMALEEMLNNAWKFSKNNTSACIEIGETQNNRGKVLYIKDNGIGFNMQNKEKLFTLFQKLHSNNHEVGQGVGLARVKRIITMHQGTIRAEGQPQKGSTFYIQLP